MHYLRSNARILVSIVAKRCYLTDTSIQEIVFTSSIQFCDQRNKQPPAFNVKHRNITHATCPKYNARFIETSWGTGNIYIFLLIFEVS